MPRLAYRTGLLALLCLISSCSLTAPQGQKPPHIVFVLADDMGYGDPHCYNADSKIATLNIDGLARDGMRFTDAHAPGALCVPSRYGLLTGQYPCRNKMNPKARAIIAEGQVTIATLLRAHGYATAMVGKWHQGFDKDSDPNGSLPLTGGPLDHGFQQFFGIPASLDIPPYYYIRDRRPVAPPSDRIEANGTEGWTRIQGAFWREGNIAPGFVHQEVLPRFTAEAERVIDAHAQQGDEKPLFLYLALTAPHTPWLPTEAFRGKSQVELYGDFVMQVDNTLGRVLQALERNGMRDNTLVIFASDNGPVWYPHDTEHTTHNASGPLRGMKADAWEGGHRVPFLARWPDRIAAQSTCDQTLCFTDMLATFAAVLDVALPPDIVTDSESILPLLEGGDEPIRQVTILKSNTSVIRMGHWKAITHLGSGGFSKPRRRTAQGGEPAGQLYDLSADLGETRNLWDEEPDQVRILLREQASLRETLR